MTNAGRLNYILDIATAAHRMGIYLRERNFGDGLYAFDWYDPMTNREILGENTTDRLEAFEVGCKKLTDYLNTNGARAHTPNQNEHQRESTVPHGT